jgi:hypothetical protein
MIDSRFGDKTAPVKFAEVTLMLGFAPVKITDTIAHGI